MNAPITITPAINTDLYEAQVAERTCGSTKLGTEIYLVQAGKPFAQMLGDGDDSGVRAQALAVMTQLNDATPRGSRPSKLQIQDRRERYDDSVARNAEHIAKTIDLNMKISQEKAELVSRLWTIAISHTTSLADHHDAVNKAVRWAAELYALRSFVIGVIRGRLYQEAEGHIDSQVAKWEEQWDTAFGDLVGKVLHMQDSVAVGFDVLLTGRGHLED